MGCYLKLCLYTHQNVCVRERERTSQIYNRYILDVDVAFAPVALKRRKKILNKNKRKARENIAKKLRIIKKK